MKPVPTARSLARRPVVWVVAVLLLALAAAAAVALLQRRPVAAVDASDIHALGQRCQAEMLRGTCGAMRADASTPVTQRVFIAGFGEVDGAAFAALRSAGDAMCSNLVETCRSDGQGKPCRIARALYPLRSTGTLLGS